MTTLVPPLCAFFRLAQVFPLLQLSLCDLLASLLLVTSVALYIAERGDVTLCSWLNTVTLVRPTSFLLSFNVCIWMYH